MLLPNCCVEATITMCSGFCPMVASCAGRIINAVMKAGASSVSTRKVRVRTRSRYSRFKMTQVLRIGLTYDIDEDFFQRRFHHFEPIQPCVGRSKPQQFLRVSTGSEA